MRLVMPQEEHLYDYPLYMTSPKDARCPMDTIPDEMVVQIFTAVVEIPKLDGYGTTSEPKAFSKESGQDSSGTQTMPQQILTHVCRRWRVIALNMPTLWTYIDFLDGPPFDRSREWIKRTRNYPLDIVLECTRVDNFSIYGESVSTLEDRNSEELTEPRASSSSHKSGKIDSQDLLTILSIILPHLYHWGSFVFISDDLWVANETLSALSTAGEAPELTRMLLSYFWNPLAETLGALTRSYAPFDGRTPKLRDFELMLIDLDWSRPSFLQGESLTSLEITSWRTETLRPSIHDFTRVLQGCSNLTHLELGNFGPGGEVSSWPSHFIAELSSLERLSLSKFRESYLAALLQHLRFPNLHLLVVKLFPQIQSDAVVAALCDVAPLRSLTGLYIEGMRVADYNTAGDLWTGLDSLIVLRIDQTTMIGSGFLAFWQQEEHFARVDQLVITGIDSEGGDLRGLVDARQDSHSLHELSREEGHGAFIVMRKREDD